jgi:hypothetical protein
MKQAPVLLSLFAALLAGAAPAREVADIELPESLQGGGTELLLNGAGVRTRFFVDVYVGGLYLMQPSRDAAAIIAADEPMAIRLHIITGLITAGLMREIDSLMGVYDDGVAKQDFFDLVYVPGKGLDVFKNGTHRATVESGLRFKRALFGIWFSDRPIQASLKRGMLGR